MLPNCIFCDNESGSEEHLWPDWMHKLVKFAPLNIQEANGPVVTGQNPEQTINTVCHTCNNGWMSRIEQKNISRLKPMLVNTPITIDPGGMKILAEWAVNRAMVAESIKLRNDNVNFYTREERFAFREKQTIPGMTRIWIGALSNSHIGCHGTDYTIMLDDRKTRIGTGSVNTVYAGHFVVQTVTEHLHPPYVSDRRVFITPPLGVCDERLVEIYPTGPKKLHWPPKPFTDEGPTGVIALRDRWHRGKKTDKIKNMD